MDQKALFIVAGKHKAKLFLAFEGFITELLEVNIPKPKYLDREGHFESSAAGLGHFYASGSVYENQKQTIIQELTRQLNLRLKAFGKVADSLYLFAPKQLEDKIYSLIPSFLKRKPAHFYEGNYLRTHPFDLLKKVKEEYEAFSTSIDRQLSTEAVKLLKNKPI